MFHSPNRKAVVKDASSNPSRTKRADKDSANINNILAKYRKTGVVENLARGQGTYIDLPDQIDYHSALVFVAKAQDAFEALPSHVRKEFDNDPGQFVDFAENPENIDRMVELGLMEPPQSEAINTPTPVEPAAVPEIPPASPEIPKP